MTLLAELAGHAAELADAAAPGRAILGIVGPPGAGKSTLAERLVAALDPEGLADPERAWVARVPMDGFHLSDAALERLGRRDRKGARDTFDADGYLALLRRLRSESDRIVWAPDFERTLEQPIAAGIGVGPGVRLVVTEGNYLCDPAAPWPSVRAALDAVWAVDLDDALRLQRLLARHVAFGKSEPAARAWIAAVDEPNAVAIRAAMRAADLRIDLAALDEG